MATSWPKKRRLLGTRVQRLDGPEKATGRAKYSLDINRPGMLHGMILRCPHAHAKIKSLDIAPAEKMPGVKAVILINNAKAGISSFAHSAMNAGRSVVSNVSASVQRGVGAATTEPSARTGQSK